MSRTKLRNIGDICADCGAPDPLWASINRGLLICDECCSIHRCLGRHVSQVKSLKKSIWNPSKLAMVRTIYTNGANSVWEHTLLDPNSTKGAKKKPNPQDPVHPVKADFIRAKHQNLAFVYRPSKEDGPLLKEDVNKQLHSSVRTANLETSLRFLSIGADPNYFHPEKGTTPLHVTAKSGQSLQAELLFVYGADPKAPDKDGLTPIDYAIQASHHDLANQLIECQYELTDRLAFYLCGRRPDHRSNQHYIVPEMADGLDQTEMAICARRKLQFLPNNLLEELAMDIYDEVDRRETDAIWLSTQNQSALVADRQTVPFLPVNPEFSSTRNQGRQKLARFNAREFALLIIDVLVEIKRRQQGLQPATSKLAVKPPVPSSVGLAARSNTMPVRPSSDEEPLYDSVASDEDYVDSQQLPNMSSVPEKLDRTKHLPSLYITMHENGELKKKLMCSEMQIHHLRQENRDMKHEIKILQNMVQKLIHAFGQCNSTDLSLLPDVKEESLLQAPSSSGQASNDAFCKEKIFTRSQPSSQRPQSMYEPRQRLTHTSQTYSANHLTNCQAASMPRDDSGIDHTHSSHSSRDSGDYDNTSLDGAHTSSLSQIRGSLTGNLLPEAAPVVPVLPTDDLQEDFTPCQEDIFRKTEQITKKIQELLISAQEGKHICFIPCSDRVYRAVLEMASLFPQNPKANDVQLALKQLKVSAFRLQAECQSLLRPPQHAIDYRFVTQQVIQCAYDIAKAAKQLVTLFQ